MNSNLDFFVAGLAGASFVAVAVALFFPFTMTAPLPAEVYETAVDKCENNEGLKELSYTGSGRVLAVCKNNAQFDFRWKE